MTLILGLTKRFWKLKIRWRIVVFYWLVVGIAFILGKGAPGFESCSTGGFFSLCFPIGLIIFIFASYPGWYVLGVLMDTVFKGSTGGMTEGNWWTLLVLIAIFCSVVYLVAGFILEIVWNLMKYRKVFKNRK